MTRPTRETTASAATITAAVGLAAIVGLDGEPGWRLGRLLVLALGTVLARTAVRRGGRARTTVIVTTGSVATAVGLGIALPHLSKAGPTATAIAGVLVLVGGLVLVVLGLGASFSSRRRRVRYPARVLLGVPVLLLAWTLAPAVAATNVPDTPVGSRTPTDLGLTHQEVTFPAADGTTLSGWYLPSADGAAVALLHGAGSTRSAVLDHAGVLARHGYGVLLYDARGHGRSDGRAMDFGWYGDDDLEGAVAFLQGRPDVDPDRIGAVGLSMGGEQAVGAAAAVEGIRAVVAEGATSRVAGDKAWLSEEHGARGAVSEVLAMATTGFVDLLADAEPPITLRAAVAASGRPTLLVAGGAVEDEPPAARHIQAGAPGSVEVWVVPGVGHTAALDDHPGAWERRVVGFLDDALSPRAGR